MFLWEKRSEIRHFGLSVLMEAVFRQPYTKHTTFSGETHIRCPADSLYTLPAGTAHNGLYPGGMKKDSGNCYGIAGHLNAELELIY